jgi:fumarate hydratase class I
MGFGGKTTLLGVKIGVLDRLPACYFVTVTYMCWADRKAAVSIDEGGEATWLS